MAGDEATEPDAETLEALTEKLKAFDENEDTKISREEFEAFFSTFLNENSSAHKWTKEDVESFNKIKEMV